MDELLSFQGTQFPHTSFTLAYSKVKGRAEECRINKKTTRVKPCQSTLFSAKSQKSERALEKINLHYS